MEISGGRNQNRVLVHRDFRQPYTIRFSNEFPPTLRDYIDEESFAYSIDQINCYFERAEKYNWKTCVQTLLGYITIGFIYNCWDSKYEHCIKQVSQFLDEQNSQVYIPLGLYIKDPALKGLRNIEIIISN